MNRRLHQLCKFAFFRSSFRRTSDGCEHEQSYDRTGFKRVSAAIWRGMHGVTVFVARQKIWKTFYLPDRKAYDSVPRQGYRARSGGCSREAPDSLPIRETGAKGWPQSARADTASESEPVQALSRKPLMLHSVVLLCNSNDLLLAGEVGRCSVPCNGSPCCLPGHLSCDSGPVQ